LADSGGGVRGQYTARLARRIAERCGLPLSELFTLRSGTSAGALNVGGTSIAGPDGKQLYSEAYIDDHWKDFCQRIFSSTGRSRGGNSSTRPGRKSPTRRSGNNPTSPTGNNPRRRSGNTGKRGSRIGNSASYPDAGIDAVLKDLAGDRLFGQLIGRVMIPAYDTYGQRDALGQLIPGTLGPWFFKSWDPVDAKQLARNVMRASSAAPTYFTPVRFGNFGCLIDGGVASNSPGMDALAEAINISQPGDDFVVVTLGTGRFQSGYSYSDLHGRTKLFWIEPVLQFYSDGQTQVTDYQLDKVLNKQIPLQFGSRARTDILRYFSFDANLKASQDSIDNKKPANLKSLQALADHTVDTTHARQFNALCQQLLALRQERLTNTV